MVVCCGLVFVESSRQRGYLLTGGQAARATCFQNDSVNVHPFSLVLSPFSELWRLNWYGRNVVYILVCLHLRALVMMTAVDFCSCYSPPTFHQYGRVNIFCMKRLHTCTPEQFALEPEGPGLLRGEDIFCFFCCVFDIRQAKGGGVELFFST